MEAPTEPALFIIDWLPVMRWTICSVVVTPCFFSSSARRIVTGTAVSASARRTAEPVTSTRFSCVVATGAATSTSCNWVLAGAASAAASVLSAACAELMPTARAQINARGCRRTATTRGLRVKPGKLISMVISDLFQMLLKWPCEPSLLRRGCGGREIHFFKQAAPLHGKHHGRPLHRELGVQGCVRRSPQFMAR